MGDLNIQIEKRDSNSGEKVKLLKRFKNIMKTHSLIDTYKKAPNNNKQEYTFFQYINNKIIKYRLDYSLISADIEQTVHTLKIYPIDRNLSKDHKPIEIIIKAQILLEWIKKLIKSTEKMVVSEISDKIREKIIEETKMIFNIQK